MVRTHYFLFRCIFCLFSFTCLTIPASALTVVQMFDNPPVVELPQSGGDPRPPLEIGEWSSQEDGINNNVLSDPNDPYEDPPVPIWNPGGFIQPKGTESPTVNSGPVGLGGAALGIASSAIKTSQFTGVIVYDDTSWGDMRTATHVTMDVKGSFAGSGGISVLINSLDEKAVPLANPAPTLWSWGAAATDIAVGANPGDVSEWTTILIPIITPPVLANEPPHIPGVGNAWQVQFGTVADFENALIRVNRLEVVGLTPDTQIDNLGFVLPDIGIAGDFDEDGDVDGADFLDWQRDQTGKSLSDWQTNFGTGPLSSGLSAVPEPSTTALAISSLLFLFLRRRF